ncbi:melanopsin [Hydra vulgaris]|uniref:Melanopsin n=1 Tax=Hydra vulgaris TaxID=6087 RepID=A0ABM4B4I3_HYDVU
MLNISLLFTVLFAIAVIFAIILNILVLYGLNLRYHKRTFKCHVWIALSVFDFVRNVFEAPLEIDAIFNGKYRLSIECSVIGYCSRFLELSSIGMLTVIIGERYISICHPGMLIRYYGKRAFSFTCISFCIFYAAFWSFMPFFGIGEFVNNGEYCCLQNITKPSVVFMYKLSLLAFAVLLPACILFYCSISTLREFKQAKERTINVFGNVYLANDCQKEEKEALLLIIMTVIMAVTWVSYYTIHLVLANHAINKKVIFTGEIFSQLTTVSTPFFLILTDKGFKATLSRVFLRIVHKVSFKTKRHVTVTSTQLFKINKNIKEKKYSSQYTSRVGKFTRHSEIEMDHKIQFEDVMRNVTK